MNERIRLLAEQARNYVADAIELGYPQDQVDDIRDEKFAELIVRECAEFARQHNLEKADRSHMVHKSIKQHFGVEE